MKIKTTELRDAFRICDNVPINLVLNSSTNVRLKQVDSKLTLSMTGILGCDVTVNGISQGGKWTAFVERDIFKKFLSTAAEDEIELFHKDKLVLKSGQRLELALPAVISGYGSWNFKVGAVYSEDILRFLKTAVRYIPVQSGTEKIQAVAFNKEALIVTDSARIMCLIGHQTNEYMLPPEIIKVITTIDDAKVSVEKTGIGVTLNNGCVFQSFSDELKNFPQDKLLAHIKEADKAPEKFTFNCSEFLEHLKVAGQFLKDKSDPVVIEEKDKTLTMTVVTASGKFQRTMKLLSSSNAPDKYSINAEKVLPWIQYISSIEDNAKVVFSRINKASVFKFVTKTYRNMLLTVDF